MPSNYTPNYQLNQWVADNRVLRTDFNTDNVKIDAALGALDAKIPRIIFGTYTGDGKRSQDIVLGFQPKALLLFRENDCVSYSFSQLLIISGMAFPGQPIASSGKIGCEITENGFQVYCDESQNIFCNYAIGYHYIAFA